MLLARVRRWSLFFALLFLGSTLVARPLVAEISESRRVDPVFFQNWPDDNHCLQASLMIVLNSLGHPVRWDDVNRGTGYEDRLYTWTITGAALLARFVKGVKLYAAIDYREFARQGELYLTRIWNPSYLALQKNNASVNFAKEQKAAQAFVAANRFELRRLSQPELFGLLRDNLVILQARVNFLFPENGPGTHYVVLYAEDGDWAWIHDPGLPARRSARLPKSRVYAAYTGELIVVPRGP